MIWLCLPHDPLLGLWNQMSREKYPYPGYPIPLDSLDSLDWLVSTYTYYILLWVFISGVFHGDRILAL